MKKLIFLVSCLLVLGSASVVAQTAPQVVAVRVQELGLRLYITTSRGDGPADIQELQAAKKESFSELAARTYRQLLLTYLEQGYVLQGVLPNKTNDDNTINTLIFVKPPKS